MFALATCHRQHHTNQPTLHGQSQARWRYDEYIYLLLLCSNGKQEGAIMQRVLIFFSQCCALQALDYSIFSVDCIPPEGIGLASGSK